MLLLTFNVKAPSPEPVQRRLARATQAGCQENEIDFDENNRITVEGENCAGVATVKIVCYPDGRDQPADEDMELNRIVVDGSTASSITITNAHNTTSTPDGEFWGIDADIVATWPDGSSASLPVTFKVY